MSALQITFHSKNVFGREGHFWVGYSEKVCYAIIDFMKNSESTVR